MLSSPLRPPRHGSRTGRVAGRTVVAAAVLLAACWRVAPDMRSLTLYEKTGRAPVVVWGEVEDGQHRLAVIRTLEVIKCDIPQRPGRRFRIAFRLDSFLRKPWEDRIVFAAGERVLLFLRKFTKQDGRQPEGDIYTLLWGAQGKQLLPAEGEKAHVDAARAFAVIHAEEDLDRQAAMLKAAISGANPLVAEAAFEQLLGQRLGDLAMLGELEGFFDNPREPLRIQAMRLIRQILADAAVAGRPVPDRRDLSDRIRGRAATDPSARFRVEAVATLHVLGGDEVKAFLRRLAREDPSQLVRYEAEKVLMDWPRRP